MVRFISFGVIYIVIGFFLYTHAVVSILPRDLQEIEQDTLGVYRQDPDCFNRAKALGAKVVGVPDKGPFFVYWLPQGATRVLLVLHGSEANAYRTLLQYEKTAGEFGVGVVALQWGWERQGGYAYLTNRVTYRMMCLALEYLSKQQGITRDGNAWLGFSRAATRCAIFAHLDRQSGNEHFCYFMAISGAVGEEQPDMREMLGGEMGKYPIKDCHFYFWAGEKDGDRVKRMMAAREMVERLGGFVDVTAVGPEGPGGFNQSRQYQQEAFGLWLERSKKD